jgi:hypothetical protein
MGVPGSNDRGLVGSTARKRRLNMRAMSVLVALAGLMVPGIVAGGPTGMAARPTGTATRGPIGAAARPTGTATRDPIGTTDPTGAARGPSGMTVGSTGTGGPIGTAASDPTAGATGVAAGGTTARGAAAGGAAGAASRAEADGRPEEPGPLFEAAERPARAREARPHVVRERFARIDRGRLLDRVQLNLFPDVVVRARRDRVEPAGTRGQVWIGRVEGRQDRALLATVDGVTVGNVHVGDRLFEIRDAGDGVSVISEVDASLLPPEGCDDGSEVVPAPPRPEAVAADPCGLIDMMVLYTPAALDDAGGQAGMEALIYLAISETNVTFEDSGITTRIAPVHIDLVQYVEAASLFPDGDVFTDRDYMIDPIDGVLDAVPVLRDRYCADVVQLITHAGGGWCGGAKTMDPAPNPAHEAKAYAVTVDGCATGNYTFGHELGHIMGARHDWYVDDEATPYTYAHGYVNRIEKWRTIMSYEDVCDAFYSYCTRKGIWSNPNVLIDGVPAGVPEGTSTACVEDDKYNTDCDAENWRTLNNTACTVASFRDRSACIASAARNVWMKDTWHDTGMEPDIFTSNQDMWKSPYIWVRHDPDPTGAQQHRHENPEFGSINHVYVKLHNDFDVAASGRLRLYYAEAATGLSWPGDWTLFADTPVNGVAAHATLIVPSTWSPPGTGHFCLLARWDAPTNPADPMTFAEGPNVGTNTRNNNNIVWRNLNVLNLEPDLTTPAPPAKVRNLKRAATTVDLAVEQADVPSSFLRKGGQVLLDLGGLLDNWQSTGARGDGARLIQHPLYGTVAEILDTPGGIATLMSIPMDSLEEEPVRLILTAPFVPPPPPFPPVADDPDEPELPTGGDAAIPDRPAGTFGLDLVQIEGTTRVGGVGYEIVVAPTGGAGAVPDGGAVPGAPLAVTLAGGDLALDWDASCRAGDVDYAVYEGTLGDFTSHVPLLCSTGGATAATVPVPAGSAYYLVVPTDGLTDGSYGRNGNGVERPGSLAACRPHAVLPCP